MLSTKEPNLFNKSLNSLFEYFNTDKGESFIDQYVQPLKRKKERIEAHGYSKFYENFFLNKKSDKCSILELGSFYGNAAASFFFYFKNSKIYSGDIKPDLFRYKSKRIESFYINTGSEKSINYFIQNYNFNFDIIIDDAGHYLKDQIISLFFFFKRLKSNGLFVVEELDFPDTRKDMNLRNEKPTLKEILLKIKTKNDFNSRFILKEDKDYFLKNYHSIEIFKGKKNEIAFIRKK